MSLVSFVFVLRGLLLLLFVLVRPSFSFLRQSLVLLPQMSLVSFVFILRGLLLLLFVLVRPSISFLQSLVLLPQMSLVSFVHHLAAAPAAAVHAGRTLPALAVVVPAGAHLSAAMEFLLLLLVLLLDILHYRLLLQLDLLFLSLRLPLLLFIWLVLLLVCCCCSSCCSDLFVSLLHLGFASARLWQYQLLRLFLLLPLSCCFPCCCTQLPLACCSSCFMSAAAGAEHVPQHAFPGAHICLIPVHPAAAAPAAPAAGGLDCSSRSPSPSCLYCSPCFLTQPASLPCCCCCSCSNHAALEPFHPPIGTSPPALVAAAPSASALRRSHSPSSQA